MILFLVLHVGPSFKMLRSLAHLSNTNASNDSRCSLTSNATCAAYVPRAMDFTGKPMKGYVYVDDPGWADDAELSAWVQRGKDFASTLPRK